MASIRDHVLTKKEASGHMQEARGNLIWGSDRVIVLGLDRMCKVWPSTSRANQLGKGY